MRNPNTLSQRKYKENKGLERSVGIKEDYI
jgi:hypothetical protein